MSEEAPVPTGSPPYLLARRVVRVFAGRLPRRILNPAGSPRHRPASLSRYLSGSCEASLLISTYQTGKVAVVRRGATC